MSILGFAWSDNQGATAHIEPMVWAGEVVHYDGPPSFTERDFGLGDAYAAGEAAAAEALTKDPGRVCIFLYGFGRAMEALPLITNVEISEYIGNGPNITAWASRADDFFRGYQHGGGPFIDLLYIDFESFNLQVWDYPTRDEWADAVATIQDNAALIGRLTQALRTADRATLSTAYGSNTVGAPLVVQWNGIIRRLALSGLKRAIGKPARARLGYVPTMCNDEDAYLRRAELDRNGWPSDAKAVRLHNATSPQFYLNEATSNEFRWADWVGSRFPAFVDTVNMAKASVGKLIPSISSFMYVGDGKPPTTDPAAWQEMVRHLGAIGGGTQEPQQRVVFWNPDESTAQQRAIHEAAFAGAPARRKVHRAATVLSADVVVTGTIRTRRTTILDKNKPYLGRSGSTGNLPGDFYSRDGTLVNTPQQFFDELLAGALASTPKFQKIMLFHLAGVQPGYYFPSAWTNLADQPVPTAIAYDFISQCRTNGIEVYRFSGFQVGSLTNRTMGGSVHSPDPTNSADRAWAAAEYGPWVDAGLAGIGFDAGSEHIPEMKVWAAYLRDTFGIKTWGEALPLTDLGAGDGPGGHHYALAQDEELPYLCADPFKTAFDNHAEWEVSSPVTMEMRIAIFSGWSYATAKPYIDAWRAAGFIVDGSLGSSQQLLDYIAGGIATSE